MNNAQLHLALNHIPVILSMATLVILLWGWVSKSSDVKKVGLVFVIVTAIFAGAAFLTGEPAEDTVEKLPNFSKEFVHEHEEAGEAALVVSIVAGLAAAAAAWTNKKRNTRAPQTYLVCTLLVLASALLFLRAAHLGGLIRHEEIRAISTN